ncbi:hypothetical protein Lser_V15G06814 [Lactuca serriola]
MARTGISHIGMVKSKLTVQTMGMLVRMNHIDPKFHPRLPEANDTITDAPKDFVGVYRVFFKSGLRLPAFNFLETVLDYYVLHITQITPMAFTMFFALPCCALP